MFKNVVQTTRNELGMGQSVRLRRVRSTCKVI